MSVGTVAPGGDTAGRPRAAHGPRRRAAAAAALLPLVLATTACGGSAGASSDDAGPLTVMTWAPDGTGSVDRPGVTALAEQLGREVNAKGGRAGRQLKVLTCNEHNTAAGVTDCAHQAVDAHAIAVVGSYSQFGDTFMPVLEAAGIPYLGGFGVSGAEFSSPLSYPVAGGTPTLIAGSGRQLVAAGCRSIALIRPDNGNGDTLTRYLSGAVAQSGVKVTDVKVPEKGLDAAGLAPLAQKAVGDDRTGGCVTMALGPEQTMQLLDAYRGLAPKHTQLASVVGSVQQAAIDATGGAKSPLNGSYATGWFPPASAKVWDDLRTTAGDAAGSGSKPIDTSDLAVQTTWVAYQTFLQAIDRVSSAGQPLNAKGLRAQLDSGDTIDTGATPPLSWGQSDMLPSAESPRLTNTWVTFQQVKAGKLTEQQSGFIDVRWVLTGGKPPQ
ncbi:ABC transporter substrate-binding protein [Kitasatospora sp. NPDC094015]|uniref:ABC transporter substrate-binding protein n=1 Tax=Kitasatospora sp. NPDC094015 TaxID=3155205 RepID=UPI00332F77B1